MGNHNCTLEESVPGSKQYLQDITERPAMLATLITCTVITIILVAFLIESACHLGRNVQRSAVSNHRVTTWWMIAVIPVMSCLVLPGIYSPVSASFCNLVASLCYSFTMFKFLVILVNYYGGYEKMVFRFSAEHFTFHLASAPLTCCCPCLPHKRLTRRSFNWLKVAVLQVAIFKPTATFIGAIVWLDGASLNDRLSDDEPFVIVNLVTILSSVVAMMALNMLYVASAEYLKHYRVGIKFAFVKIGILICNIQPSLLSMLMRFRILGCSFPYTNHARANVMQCALFILESGILFPFIWIYYRDSKHNVVGSASREPAIVFFTDPPGISDSRATRTRYLPRTSIMSTAGSRLRAETVLGTGDVDVDFTQIELTVVNEIQDNAFKSGTSSPTFESKASSGQRHSIG